VISSVVFETVEALLLFSGPVLTVMMREEIEIGVGQGTSVHCMYVLHVRNCVQLWCTLLTSVYVLFYIVFSALSTLCKGIVTPQKHDRRMHRIECEKLRENPYLQGVFPFSLCYVICSFFSIIFRYMLQVGCMESAFVLK
jgi:hypothetical protein